MLLLFFFFFFFFCPDMTFAVDWALRINYLSTRSPSASSVGGWGVGEGRGLTRATKSSLPVAERLIQTLKAIIPFNLNAPLPLGEKKNKKKCHVLHCLDSFQCRQCWQSQACPTQRGWWPRAGSRRNTLILPGEEVKWINNTQSRSFQGDLTSSFFFGPGRREIMACQTLEGEESWCCRCFTCCVLWSSSIRGLLKKKITATRSFPCPHTHPRSIEHQKKTPRTCSEHSHDTCMSISLYPRDRNKKKKKKSLFPQKE